VTGPREHECVLDLVAGEKRFQQIRLGRFFHVVETMFHVVRRRGIGGDLDPHRIAEQVAERRTISGGIVAENISVCRFAGVSR